MKLERIREILQAEVIVGGEHLQREVKTAGASDMMSDVLSFVKPGSLLLTGLVNSQSVRTAELAEIVAVCYVRSKQPLTDTIELAREKAIPLLSTHFTLYESCGRLFQNGLPGRKVQREN
jgi:predicted transcriptional regulator